MIKRVINDIEIDVDEHEANVFYFDNDFAKKINSFKMEDIIQKIYEERNEYIPLTVFNEITPLCNFKCPFCYINHNIVKFNFPNLNDYLKIYADLIEKGMLYCTLTGGEILSHPYFFDIYKFLKENGVIVSLFTNGSLFTEEHYNLFKQYKPFQIEISIYSIEENNFSNITGQSEIGCDKVLNNILELKKMGINVKCKTQLNKLTIKGFEKIKEWCILHQIPYYYSSELQDRYDGTSTQEYDLEVEQHDKIYKDRLKKSNAISEFGVKKYFECGAGKYGLMISYDLKIRPCASFYSIKEACFTTDSGIKLALSNLKSYIETKKGKPLMGCSGCNAEPICKECILSDLLTRRKKCEFYINMMKSKSEHANNSK